jgi:hypothetical protein
MPRRLESGDAEIRPGLQLAQLATKRRADRPHWIPIRSQGTTGDSRARTWPHTPGALRRLAESRQSAFGQDEPDAAGCLRHQPSRPDSLRVRRPRRRTSAVPEPVRGQERPQDTGRAISVGCGKLPRFGGVDVVPQAARAVGATPSMSARSPGSP